MKLNTQKTFLHYTFQTPKNILKQLRLPRNLVVLFAHWILHAYAIVGITGLDNPALHMPMIGMVPFPAIFYIFTVKYTDPRKLITH